MTPRVGIIGGSGLYSLAEVAGAREEKIPTPFGDPSSEILLGEISGHPVAFLSRHGRGHRISPSEINYRANIFALKLAGCEAIFSAAAVGSLREELAPTHVCIPDQFLDRTRHRADTFFGNGIAVHVSLADPVCPVLAGVLADCTESAGAKVWRGGTYVCMEGPQFSTRAESFLYRSWSADVIGMTNLTEARLAREAEACYATMAMITDYDCWRENTDAVSVEAVTAVLAANAALAKKVLFSAVPRVESARVCSCRDALKFALITDPTQIPVARKAELDPFFGKYWRS